MKLGELDRLILDVLNWQPISNAELAQALGFEPARVHRSLGKLQKGGLVKNLKNDQSSLEGYFSTPGRYVLVAPQPAVDPDWLAWNNRLIPNTAATIRSTQDFSSLPVLADMLEEAGCEDAFLLNHLRDEPQHTTHCWALRLLSEG